MPVERSTLGRARRLGLHKFILLREIKRAGGLHSKAG
jgi:hypothetical protein